MGRVYEAELLAAVEGAAAGQRVALKVLRAHRASAQDLARFRQEARAAARVGHPAIVRVLDFAELADGTSYLAMERLRGQSVEDWLSVPGRLYDALGWLAGFARGLAAAHRTGIVHRDIKPANLFLQVDPANPKGPAIAKILDFGIAKVVRKDATQIETQAGTLLGTPYYIAPERALGRTLDARADLYSLGVILYEVLTGWVPFEAENFMDILAQHIRAQPLDPRQAAPDRALPDSICRLTMQLLAKEPDGRPPDGDALAAQLDAIAQRERAAVEAVATGPRAQAGASAATMHLRDVAERPTAVPGMAMAVATEARGPKGTTRLVMAPTAAPAKGSPPRSASGGGWRWPLLLGIGGLLVVAIGVWVAIERAQAGGDAQAGDDAPTPAVIEAQPPTELRPAVESPPANAASTGGVAPTAGSSATSSETGGESTTGATPTASPTSGATTSAERPKRRSPRKNRPKPQPDAPPPPNFKDDVYD